MMARLDTLRRRVAKVIYPEIFREAEEISVMVRTGDVGAATILRVVDAFQKETGLSHWEVAANAGVNNRAILILRDGRRLQQKSAAKLIEYLREAWPFGAQWPLTPAEERVFGTVLTIPAVEIAGGPEAVHELVLSSGHRRTLDAVHSWKGRSGVPHYARHLIRVACAADSVALSERDFEPARLAPAEIAALRAKGSPRPPKSKDTA